MCIRQCIRWERFGDSWTDNGARRRTHSSCLGRWLASPTTALCYTRHAALGAKSRARNDLLTGRRQVPCRRPGAYVAPLALAALLVVPVDEIGAPAAYLSVNVTGQPSSPPASRARPPATAACSTRGADAPQTRQHPGRAFDAGRCVAVPRDVHESRWTPCGRPSPCG